MQDLRRAFQGQAFHAEWYRYVAGGVQGAGIPLLIAGMMLSLAVLLTAAMRVTSACGDAALDDETELEDDGDGAEVGDVE